MPSLVPIATVVHLAELLEVDVDDNDRAEALLVAASTLVRAHTGSPWVDADGNLEWVSTTNHRLQLVADALTSVTTAAAGRAYRNPRGATYETTGPFSVQLGDAAALGVYLTDSEKEVLDAAVAAYRGIGSPGLWTLSTTREEPLGASDLGIVEDYTGTIYAETDTGAPIPWLQAGELA